MSQAPDTSEATALWTAVFGEPPSVQGDESLMLRLILESLPPVDYVRFAQNWKRPDAAPASPRGPATPPPRPR